ncbi:helix-turn-helix transcriptional regulator [Mucilaginibacter aquaedulcis]|uniref:helix-turn-helix transcriptional regulator n=1 Tax=Mucilaginibacter aquaedulcis TaxID=1187081 RepID=UPI0025B3DF2F|nr:helix-turn-helix transcriptional regulator [Mucilaginibacter aquaedulcis]MDN3547563.1 LuxR C-terminal-related transcriptional regulator [Mucilaginibacter aquaedulcis]
MELIERAGFLALLQAKFENVAEGEGHCIMISGEAGMGKTSLVRAFCRERKKDSSIYQGTCDALFSPRPLAPLYDIAWQLGTDLERGGRVADRAGLFTRFLHEVSNQKQTTIIVFEDIHWADEATLDFIKFFARRITQIPCLFLLTFRDDEIHSRHPLRTVLGQLPPDSFTRVQLTPLSREVVDKMAGEKGYNGDDVYAISGGNPFYVSEILASYSPGVPDNIKDSILSVYNRLDDKTKQVWQILSVMPTGLEVKYLEKMEPCYAQAIENCLEAKILIPNNGLIHFKHELYRRTIELSLSPFLRVSLNKRVLELFLESFESGQETERIIHHAKNANEYEMVVHYVPLAAKKAACVGAHIEASKLYLSAIEYYQGHDKDVLIGFYESYAYECYLTNQIKEAIVYQTKALNIWREKNDAEKIGNCMRFLSRLWWFDGNRKQAEKYGNEAIGILSDQQPSSAKAMAFSNMSQLKMLSGEPAECIFWGTQAIEMAQELGNDEILSHALNNVGTVQMEIKPSEQKGLKLLQQSLDIALKNSYHEHAARAYVNMASNAVKIKDYELAKKTMDAGISYCEKRNLDSWSAYMLAHQARVDLETGNWDEASRVAESLVKNEMHSPIVKIGALVVLATIKMRKGDTDVFPLLAEAKSMAFETMELQRIIPALVALLEYEWITDSIVIEKAAIDTAISMVERMGNIYENNEFAFWLLKARKQHIPLREFYEGYQVYNPSVAMKAADLWEQLGCPYEQALALFEGDEPEKRRALIIVQQLGADAVYQKMKLEMRSCGIKNIPRGQRKSTRSNSARLTERELDVLQLLKEGMQNKEIAARLFISAKTVDHHISSILFKLEVSSRAKAVQEAISLNIIK